MPNLKPQTVTSLQRKQIDLIQSLNRDLAATPGAPDQLEGVIQSFELAFKMQGEVPELLDISKEPQSVLDAYGVKPGPAGSFARQCLMARRLSEAGVRFVEICHPGWDQHNNLHRDLIKNSAATDQPTAALLDDLGQRGLLDETLILFGSEFGRMPTAQGPDGRDHNITGYPMWLAGAGVKKGFSPDLSLRRPRFPINRCGGQRGSGDLRLNRRECAWRSPVSDHRPRHAIRSNRHRCWLARPSVEQTCQGRAEVRSCVRREFA